jgi:hypothetical protein
MSDALVDLGIQDALRYVHVNILPSVVLVCRDVAHIAVISVSCVFFAWSLARASSLFGAAWVFAKAAAALSAFQLVWARVVDPFVYDKTREYVELGKRRRFAAENSAMGSLFSPPSRGAGAIGRGAGTPGKTREDPLAEKRRAVANGGTPGTPGSVAGTPRAGTPAGSRLGSRQNSFRADGLFDGAYAATGASRPDAAAAADAALVAAGPSCSAGLRLAAVPVGRRGMPLSALRDGSRVAVELRGVGGDGDGWSEGFLCVHPHKTYETAAVMGALNWGGHQLVVACRGATEAMCRGEVLNVSQPAFSPNKEKEHGAETSGFLNPRGERASPEAHERDVARFVFRVHLFGSGREITLRNEGTGTLVTTFVSGVKFERRRVVAWHKQRSSKVLTASSTMFSPPEGGAWEELALVPVRRTKLGLVPAEDDGETSESCEFAFCRPREGTFWKHDAGDDGMMAFTKTLAEASPFRLHDADAGEAFFSDHRRRD